MNKTGIEWVRNLDGTPGYTWNPITGCLNGCEYCYARRLANTRLRERYLANRNIAGETCPAEDYVLQRYNDPFYPRFWPERLKKPYNPIKPVGIFVCDMSDLFGVGIPEEWTQRVFEVIRDRPQHRFYLLTKQPQNLIKWSTFPDNCWVGVSADIFSRFNNAHHWLRQIEAPIKFMSFEPLLEDMKWSDGKVDLHGIDWVIIGAQTKSTVYPKIEWVQEILVACHNANIPVFMKKNLRPLIEQEWGNWKLRQEMPIREKRNGE